MSVQWCLNNAGTRPSSRTGKPHNRAAKESGKQGQPQDAFFDYSRLDAQSTPIQLRAFPLESVFEQLRNSFSIAAADKGLRLRIRPTRAWVQSDPSLLHRILLNLVSNAVQHTHQGSILVSCRPTRGFTCARIEVWDSGVGIAPEHHEKIFEEFFQVENQERDRSKGLGLGLSIVERSCKLLNHPMTMRSRLGGVRLPPENGLHS